jgi:hypothetical protein
MTNFLKYLSTIVLAIAILGCQNDSPEETASQQQQQQSQQPGQLGQMNQPSAPSVDVSDEEAGKFADAAMEAQQIQMQAQQRMVGIIEDEGLDVQTYQTIAQSTQSGGQAPDSISDGDMERYQNATESLKEVQAEIQEEIVNAVENAGMEMQRFQEISRAAQQDQELQKQIQQQLQEKMGQQGGPGGMQQQPPQGN